MVRPEPIRNDLPASKTTVALRWVGLMALLVCGVWMLGSLASSAAAVRAFKIPTGSMAPALAPGDRICVDTAPNVMPKRGEIWVLKAPPSAVPGGLTFVKRIIALPGETVQVSGGRVLIDGQVLDEPYLKSLPSYTHPPTKLEPKQYFVLGDSRNTSNDSHVWGPLHQDLLIGRVLYRYWPLKRIGGP